MIESNFDQFSATSFEYLLNAHKSWLLMPLFEITDDHLNKSSRKQLDHLNYYSHCWELAVAGKKEFGLWLLAQIQRLWPLNWRSPKIESALKHLLE
ncbi:hypothetical protein [Nostoc sp. CHAB 5836]|uniref:hypothetical protein n=1 Tax=Nostoc sp. CHAB 5836 TaxID=2780404 RepID=UPI002795C42E|nr:hypothetical protein [Nostoc sp. CHAB 5836]